MSETIIKRQLFKYNVSTPYVVYNIGKSGQLYPLFNNESLLEHWHSEMEIVYNFVGSSSHFIDGQEYIAANDSLILVNSNSIHHIEPDIEAYKKADVAAVVLIISETFLEKILPDFHHLYFVNTNQINHTEIKRIMTQISNYAQMPKNKYDYFLITGLVYQLFYWLCRDCMKEKDLILPLQQQKSLERLRGILQYIDNHYTEKLTQLEMAKRFYFTREYFSRFFKKYTGMTFKEYLKKYRTAKSLNDVLHTEKKILDIALDYGFPDERAFINAFKQYYQNTPLQYRKLSVQKM